MSQTPSLNILRAKVSGFRRRLFFIFVVQALIRAFFFLVPIATILIALDQRWGGGSNSVAILVAAATIAVAASLLWARYRLGSPFRSILAVDDCAHLNDRISSAWEFLSKEHLNEPQQVQVQDAIKHVDSLVPKSLFRINLPKVSYGLPLLAIALILSFFVPPQIQPQPAEATVSLQKSQQIDELQKLQEEALAEEFKGDKELEEVLKKIREVEKKFEEGDMTDRDVMIELARLDEDLRQKMAQLGAEQLEGEMNQIVPHLMASAASQMTAKAIKENKLDEAAEEMEKLADKVKKNELTDEEKKELSMNMGVAASKLGKGTLDSLGGDLSKGSESLESGDSEGFSKSAKSMGNKFKMVKKHRQMKKMRMSLSLCKSCLGQCQGCKECNGAGCKACNGLKPGGNKAGTAESGNPFGDPSRLSDSYQMMVRVEGMLGDGPIDTEVEITEGQTSTSMVDVQEVYSEYAAVAEEAIEQEDIPLSHRFHVKRYFQAIRPTE
ncbi:MAG: hypothetical protein KC964_06920 [Candidatus Omnitrophica bacterium]|nr:hypothetical protein [Candidatus Omnitrophota bacterium]